MVDLLPDAILVIRGGRVAYANAAAKELLGRELVDCTPDAILAPGERARLDLLVEQREHGWPAPAACRLRFLRLGDRAEITTDLRFRRDGDALVLSARDVTDVTRAEALMGSLADLASRDGALLDADALLDATSPAFLALGWTVAFTELVPGGSITRRVIAAPDDPVGTYGRSLVGVELPREKTPVLAEVARTGRPIFLDNLPTLLDGPPRAARALGESMQRAQVSRSAWCPVLTNGVLTHHLAVTGKDLTEHDFVAVQLFAAQLGAAIHMQVIRHELVHKERLAAVGEMAAVMAHEVRNPIGVVFNAVANLRKKSGSEPLLDILQEESERLQRLVTDLLDFSRPLAVQWQREALAPILHHAVEAARLDPGFEGAARPVELVIADESIAFETDPPLLHRALVNLLVNALQYVSGSGQVRLSAHVDGEDLELRVHNDGACVAPEVAGRIFEPFFTTRASGTGLGLAVTRRIIVDLGGAIALLPQEATGTTFVIRLPLERGATAPGGASRGGAR